METNFGPRDFQAFAYLDYHNPTVSWNIARGAFCSPSLVPEYAGQNSFISVSMAGLLANSSRERLRSEIAIDEVRLRLFPNCVSRLTGFFVFDEIESIARFWDSNSWGGHFSDDYLSDVFVTSTKSTRIDSNWISRIVNANGELLPSWYNNAISYWRGDICVPMEPIWERIVEGNLTVWSNRVRGEAVREILSVWPNSSNLLSYACFCAAYGSYDGILFPYMTQPQNDVMAVTYTLRMVQANDADFINAIAENANNMPFAEVELGNITHNRDVLGTPDLRNFNMEFLVEELRMLESSIPRN